MSQKICAGCEPYSKKLATAKRYGRGIETACCYLWWNRPTRWRGKWRVFFLFFIRLSNASAAAAIRSMLILDNVMVCLWHKTRNGACGEKRLASYMCIYLFLSVRPAATTETFTIIQRCVASTMVMWILFFNCIAIVRPLQQVPYWTDKRNSYF